MEGFCTVQVHLQGAGCFWQIKPSPTIVEVRDHEVMEGEELEWLVRASIIACLVIVVSIITILR